MTLARVGDNKADQSMGEVNVVGPKPVSCISIFSKFSCSYILFSWLTVVGA